METTKTLEILKQAILLEKRGKAFYTTAAEKSDDPDVKHIFTAMAEEETEHVKFLAKQYKSYEEGGKFADMEVPADSTIADEVLSEKMAEKINAASFEAAAIASAIEMENKAIALYDGRAKEADDPEEKKFYNWLADWERGHHQVLYKLDQELKEKVWNDNSFWPF